MSGLREKRKRRIRKRTIYAIILIVMLLCFLMIGFLLLFQVRRIEVEGNRYLSNQEVADWLQSDEWSSNSAYLMAKYYLTKYDLLPAMEKAKVTMKNPWTLKVTVAEKQIVGYIVLGDECAYFDEDGMVLALTTEWWDDVSCIEGLGVEQVKVFEALPVSEDNKKVFAHLLDLSQSLKKYELTPNRIVCSGSDLHLYFGNICVNVGNDDFGDKIAQITPILEKLGDQKGTLHLEKYSADATTISFEKDVLPEENVTADSGEASEGENSEENSDETGEDTGEEGSQDTEDGSGEEDEQSETEDGQAE